MGKKFIPVEHNCIMRVLWFLIFYLNVL